MKTDLGQDIGAAEVPQTWTFKNEAVADNFDVHVRNQLSWYEPLSHYVADIALSFVPQNGTLYDIGASTGNITKLLEKSLSERQAVSVSIEPSHEMAKHWTGKGELFVIEGEYIDYFRRRPDVAVLFLTLMFMKPSERRIFLQKLLNAVQPGGAVILVDKGYIDTPEVQVACKAAQLAEKLRSGTSGDSYVTKELSLRGQQRPTNIAKIRELFDEQGFAHETIFRFGEFYGMLAVKREI